MQKRQTPPSAGFAQHPRLWDDRGSLDEWVTPLRAGIEDGTIRPIVAAEIPFDRAADAHRMLQERRNVGKVVLVP